MYLYLFHRENKDERQPGEEREDRPGFSERLVRRALQDYCARLRLELPAEALREAAIERTEKGKPFFSELSAPKRNGLPSIHFSVSHSGSWWGCLMAGEPVGFDLEAIRKRVNYRKIAQRFYSEEESEWVEASGSDTFFDIWVRKEAYVKYLGTGLSEGLSSFSTVEGGGFLPKVILEKCKTREQLHCYISPIDIGCGVKAAYCSGSGNPVKARIDLKSLEID